MTKHLHGSHPAVAKRLRRVEGHLRSVVAMIEEGRPCLDLAQQLHAIERAVSEAKRVLIRDHIDHCLDDAADQTAAKRRASMEEFKQITKYL
ncbi:metal resistance protein [Falsiroseomonas bella]|uniref:Metal resistance protein n=1 Tax=Falsiroseomonas bella TaxID=2184016 RepID=A0A317FE99_9PROT|nr:metal-sensing transcriptional repressor [Falsiroseomonas bella]PWS35896.1 metal resistance protein [Falsiroseomonas bella]